MRGADLTKGMVDRGVGREARAGRSATGAIIAALLMAGCAGLKSAAPSPGAAGAVESPRLSLEDCTVLDGSVRARCGSYRVDEDRTRPGGRQISLKLVVLPATGSAPAAADPVFLLAGGPGQAATDLAAFAERLATARRDRDFVLVDQRGTGGSNALACAEEPEGLSDYGPDADAYWDRCLRELGTRADLRHYTTADAVEDYDEVRAALGYERVNLVGGSYGTRVAQVYLRRYPERVRSTVLWAVAPLGSYSIPLDGGLAIQAAMARLLDECRADEACGAAYPRLAIQFDSLLLALADHPVRVTVPAAGGSASDTSSVQIDDEVFTQTVTTLLYNASHLRRVPAVVDRVARGDWSQFASIASQVIEGGRDIPDGIYLSVVCTEDAPHTSLERLQEFRGPFGTVLRRSAESLLYRCGKWPRADLRGDREAPPRTSSPVLLLSGTADPATPPGGGELVARSLANARHIEVPAASHGPIFPGCVKDLVGQFIAHPNPAALEASCLSELRWDPFLVANRSPAS